MKIGKHEMRISGPSLGNGLSYFTCTCGLGDVLIEDGDFEKAVKEDNGFHEYFKKKAAQGE